MPLAGLALRLPAWATAVTLLIGSALAAADLLLQPQSGIVQAINWSIIAASGLYLATRVATLPLAKENTTSWLTAAAGG